MKQAQENVLNLAALELALRKACGYFVLLDTRDKKPAEGVLTETSRHNIRFVTLSSNFQQLSRSRREVKQDTGDSFYLAVQDEGNALISQHETSHWLRPGDMVLIDSQEPSEFTFFGEFNKLTFILLERPAVLTCVSTAGGNFLPKLDPLNGAISALLEKICQTPETDETLGNLLRDALFSAVAIMVYQEPQRERTYDRHAKSGIEHALRISCQYMDSRYRDPQFNIREMADTLRLSMRQVQRGFSSLGMTPSKYLLIKRLEHARKEIDQIIAGKRDDLISTIAFEAGFSDLSYFQRTFRRAFGNSPREYLSGIADVCEIEVPSP